jgi:hypothetical protein
LRVPKPATDRRSSKLDPIGNGKLRPRMRHWLSGPIRRYCQGAEDIELRWELAPSGGVPGSYGFDAIARVKMRDGRPDRRFLMWRVRRYDPKLLSESLAELGWKTIERIDYGPDGKKSMALMLQKLDRSSRNHRLHPGRLPTQCPQLAGNPAQSFQCN